MIRFILDYSDKMGRNPKLDTNGNVRLVEIQGCLLSDVFKATWADTIAAAPIRTIAGT